MNARNFFNKEELANITTTIRHAEQKTTGEIRVHIGNKTNMDVIKRAWQVFASLQMHLTKERNGILIYLSVKDHQIAIVGDEGIHEKTGDGFWQSELDNMIAAFKEEKYVDGLIQCISDVGEKLKGFFPKRNKANNELPDDITFDDE